VHQQGDERDDDQRQTDVEGDRMLRREAIEPLDELCHCRASQDSRRRRSIH